MMKLFKPVSILLLLTLNACVHTDSGSQRSSQAASADEGEPCGEVFCEATEHCELLPLACPPNEVCAAVMEEVCVPNDDDGEQGGGGDGGEAGSLDACASDADCPGGACWATEAPMSMACQPFHNGACICGPILFP